MAFLIPSIETRQGNTNSQAKVINACFRASGTLILEWQPLRKFEVLAPPFEKGGGCSAETTAKVVE